MPSASGLAAQPVASACRAGPVAAAVLWSSCDAAVVVVVAQIPHCIHGRIGRPHRQHTALPEATSLAACLRRAWWALP